MSDTLTLNYPFWMLLLNQLLVLALVAICTWAAFNDVKEYKIPNAVVLLTLLLYIPFVLTSAENIDWLDGLTTFAVVLVAGFLLFATGIIGAGDIKFFAALALWSGSTHLNSFIIAMSITGLVLAAAYIGTIVFQKNVGLKPKNFKPSHVVLPYGVAITGGAYYVAYQLLQPLTHTSTLQNITGA